VSVVKHTLSQDFLKNFLSFSFSFLYAATTYLVVVLLDATLNLGQAFDMNFLKPGFSVKAKGSSSVTIISVKAWSLLSPRVGRGVKPHQ
jgi:hypothetical protein